MYPEKKYNHVFMVELASVLERALNFMHTGNTAVIATTVMNPLWIGRAILKDGFPSLNPSKVRIHGSEYIQIDKKQWPTDLTMGNPHSSSRRAQTLTYGESHFSVCESLFSPAIWPPIETLDWRLDIRQICSSESSQIGRFDWRILLHPCQ
jgi:hypothetical protein